MEVKRLEKQIFGPDVAACRAEMAPSADEGTRRLRCKRGMSAPPFVSFEKCWDAWGEAYLAQCGLFDPGRGIELGHGFQVAFSEKEHAPPALLRTTQLHHLETQPQDTRTGGQSKYEDGGG